MSRLSKRRLYSALVTMVALACGVWALGRLRISTDITRFIPDASERELGALASRLPDSELARTWILSIEAPDARIAAEASRALEVRLRREPEIASIRGGAGPQDARAVRALYARRSVYLWDPSPTASPRRLSEGALRARARALKRALSLPTGTLLGQTAGEDPLLGVPAALRRLDRVRSGALSLHDGRLISADGRHALLFLITRDSPFATGPQARLQAAIRRAFTRVNATHGGVLRLAQSALHRFALASERSIRADLTRVGGIGAALVLLLFALVFRSWRQVLLLLLPLSVGISAALTASVLLLGEVHGVTLAFGATLIGVCVDYAIHLLMHHAVGGFRDTGHLLRSVWPAVRLGGLTTVAGLAGLAVATFPGLRQIALFASVGVLGALVATRVLLPPWLPREPARVGAARRLAAVLGRVPALIRRRQGWVVLGWALLLVGGAVGLSRLRWVDSLSALQRPDPALQEEDEAVRNRVSRMDSGRFVVAMGDDMEQALQRNDRAYDALVAAREEGLLEAFRSLHDLLWSKRRQGGRLQALRADLDLPARLDRSFVAEGFAPGAFAPFAARIALPPPPLGWDELVRSSLGGVARTFRFEVEGRIAILTFVRGVVDPARLARRLESLGGVAFLDQPALLARAYGRYRVRTLEMLAVGLVAVLALVILRYRRLDHALAVILPALLAALGTLGLLGLLGMEANLMHLVALLLVLSMGVDYGVFVVEHGQDDERLGATLAGVLLSCLTTVLSFGLLAMSTVPALRALGLAVAVGVFLALCLAPASTLLLGRGARR